MRFEDVRLAVKTLATSGQPIDSAVLGKFLNVSNSELSKVQSLMVKAYFVDEIKNYDLSADGNYFVLVPKSTFKNGVKNLKQTVTKNPVTKNPVTAKKDNVFKPDSLGRIRVPSALMRSIGSQASKDSSTEIWLTRKEDGRVKITTTPPKNLKGYRRYTPDQYNNLLFKAPEASKTYRMAKVGKDIVVSPVE